MHKIYTLSSLQVATTPHAPFFLERTTSIYNTSIHYPTSSGDHTHTHTILFFERELTIIWHTSIYTLSIHLLSLYIYIYTSKRPLIHLYYPYYTSIHPHATTQFLFLEREGEPVSHDDELLHIYTSIHLYIYTSIHPYIYTSIQSIHPIAHHLYIHTPPHIFCFFLRERQREIVENIFLENRIE